MNSKQVRFIYPALILLVSAAVILPVLLLGVPHGTSDLTHHLQITNALIDGIAQGNFFPSWVFPENEGFGAVTVRFYPPLFHYSLAISKLVTGNWTAAVFLTFTFWSFVGGYGVYQWANYLLENGFRALIAAFVFILAPYHLNQFYNSFMFGEFVALSVLPFVFLYAVKICDKQNLTDVFRFAFFLSLLILSNIPQTVISALVVGVYVLLNLEYSRIGSQIGRLLLGGALSVAATSFYWLKMLSEKEFLNINQPNTDPHYDYRNHFLLNSLAMDEQGIWFAALMFLISVGLLLAGLGISQNFRAAVKDRRVRQILVLFVFSGLMVSPLSRPLWDSLMFLQKVQFPWRFLSVLMLAVSIVFGYCFNFLTPENLARKRPLILILVGALFIYGTFSIKQIVLGAIVLSPPEFSQMAENTRRQPGLEHWRMTYWDSAALANKEKISVSGRSYEITKWDQSSREFTISPGAPQKIRLAIFYYPHWTANVNGREVQIEKDADGSLLIPLTAEESAVKLVFREPALLKIALYVSGAVWLLLIAANLIYRRRGSLS